MVFAAIDATGWAVIIAAICSGVGAIVIQVVGMVLASRRDEAKAKRDAETSANLAAVGTKMDTVTVKTDRAAALAQKAAQVAVASDKKADARGDLLAKVADQTNGYTNGLMEQLRDKDALIEDLRTQLAAIALVTDPAKAAPVVEAISAGKSGVFKVPQPRDPATRERRDDK